MICRCRTALSWLSPPGVRERRHRLAAHIPTAAVDAPGSLLAELSLEETAAFPYYPGGDGHSPYGEGLLGGYRHYDDAPLRQLRALAKVMLNPGMSERVLLALPGRAFARFDPERACFVASAGEYEISVGR